MNNTAKIILAALIGTVLGASAILLIKQNTYGSVPVGNDYQTYNASSTSASATVPVVVKAGFGSFGSIIIASTSPTVAGAFIGIYDNAIGTSSATSTLIARIPVNASGVIALPFDRDLKRGLTLDVPPGFNGQWVFTFR